MFTSFVPLTHLLHRVFEEGFPTRPCSPTSQCLRPKYLLSKLPPRFMRIRRIFQGKTFLPNWWNLDWPREEIGSYSTIAPNGITGPLKWFSESPFARCFPVCQEVFNIPQMARAFHRISRHCSSNPDCSKTAEVPSFTRRTALSAMPFVSDR